MNKNIKTTRGKLSLTTLSYAAGFIDADGCIAITKQKNRYSEKLLPSYYLRITVMGVDKPIIDWFKDKFNGSVNCKMSRHGESCYKDHHRIQWRWEASGKIAMNTIKQVIPYLMVKKDQAIIGIKFQEEKEKEWKKYRGKNVPIEISKNREYLYKQMRELKTKGETLEAYRSRRD